MNEAILNPYFLSVDEFNKGAWKPASKNRVCVSRLKNIYTTGSTGNYCIAFVQKGTELYEKENKVFRVKDGHFFSYCSQSPVHGIVESKTTVHGVCLTVDFNTISEAFSVLSRKESIDLDNDLNGFFQSPLFFENVYSAKSSDLGKFLAVLSDTIDSGRFDVSGLNKELFLDLAEKIVLHENQNLKGLYSLSSIHPSTKKEILKRVFLGKEFMDDNFNQKLRIKEIAKVSMLSEFHFFRSFKEVFKVSPYQYLLRKRLQYAYEKLGNPDIPVVNIISDSGFADIYSFSKAFKKLYGYPPSQMKRV